MKKIVIVTLIAGTLLTGTTCFAKNKKELKEEILDLKIQLLEVKEKEPEVIVKTIVKEKPVIVEKIVKEKEYIEVPVYPTLKAIPHTVYNYEWSY